MKVKNRRTSLWRKLRILLLPGFLLLMGALLYTFWDLPSINSLPDHYLTPSVRITDRNGRLLYEILPEVGGRNTVLSVENIPQCLKDATIAVEDQNFYTHPGIDITGIIRALWINLKGGQTIAGGSTITQQVARNILLGENERLERTYRRKIREAILAWQMTRKLSKDEILALYLNQINYGGMAYGVEAASQTYFGKPANDLLLPECALIAGLPQAPGVYNPFTNPDLAKERQRVVLGLMEKQGYLTHEERIQAEATPLSFNPSPYPIEAPHFIWIIKDQLDTLTSAGVLNPRQSLVVRTTLDLDYQSLAETTLKRRIAGFKNENTGISHNVNNAALVALDPHNGEILALVGSADYFDEFDSRRARHGDLTSPDGLRVQAIPLCPGARSCSTKPLDGRDIDTRYIDYLHDTGRDAVYSNQLRRPRAWTRLGTPIAWVFAKYPGCENAAGNRD